MIQHSSSPNYNSNKLGMLESVLMNQKEKPRSSRTGLLATFAAAVLILLLSCLLTYILTRHAFEGGKDDEEYNKLPNPNPNPNPNPDPNPTQSKNPNPNPNEPIPTLEAEPAKPVGPSASDLRLPKSVIPVSYDLVIKTYLPGYGILEADKNLTFEGQVTINLEAKADVRKIQLNAKNITIRTEKCSISVNGAARNIKTITLQPEFEKLHVDLDESIGSKDVIELKLAFVGKISSDLGGLYQSVYTEKDGTTKIAAVTQMEPTDARRMVPCFDEPEYKANWTVTVIHPKGTSAISNGIETGSVDVQDFVSTSFKTTPRMSSYLLAIVVSEFEYQEKSTSTGIRFRVWSRPEAKEMTSFALEAGVKCIEFYEKYYGIPFPLEKQDMIALPDFSAGAMENWGLVTYREVVLLYNERLYTMEEKRRVAVVVAHELAHMWFGNLVTMQWWDDLWLNEGFATMVEYSGTDRIGDGNWKMLDFMTIDALPTALDADSVSSAHPLSFKIDKAEDVSEAFDSITYEKGGSMLSMIRHVMGEEAFSKGVKIYLTRHAFGNAKAADLWAALNEAVPDDVQGPYGKKLSVPDFADTWTSQMGFPYLIVDRINDTTVKISQKRYKVNAKAVELEKYRNPKHGFKWDVPIWYQHDATVEMAWLPKESDLYLQVPSTQTLVVNVGAYGIYHVLYKGDEMNKIINTLANNHESITNRTRTRLIADAYAMATIDELDYDTVFNLVKYGSKETDYLPWSTLVNEFGDIMGYFGGEPESKDLKTYLRQFVKPQAETMKNIAENFMNETIFYENLLSTSAFLRGCGADDLECQNSMKDTFDKQVLQKCKNTDKLSDCSNITPPLRQSVYCYGVKMGTPEDYLKMRRWYVQEDVQAEKRKLLAALACSRDVYTLKNLLMNAIDREDIRFQDASSVFYYVSGNVIGSQFITNFVLTRWPQIIESFSSDTSQITKIIASAIGGIRTNQEIAMVRSFIKLNPANTTKYNAFTKELEKAETRVKWLEKNAHKILTYFKNL